MKKLIVTIAVLMVVSFSASADEPDTRNPLDKYRGNSITEPFICKLTFGLAQARAKNGEGIDEQSDYVACIEKTKSSAKTSLAKALRTVKKPKAQEALKSYHVAFVTALQGISPGSDERVIDYERRQQALKDKVDEAWARFEVEQ